MADRWLRALLAFVVPNPKLFRLSLIGAKLAGPFKALLPGRLKGMVAMVPASIPAAAAIDRPQVVAAEGKRLRRVALLTGCAQQVLRPDRESVG